MPLTEKQKGRGGNKSGRTKKEEYAGPGTVAHAGDSHSGG